MFDTALHDSEILDWPTKSDDFFPYGSDDHGYWTGYFTSRPTSKRMIRETSSILNSAKQLVAKVYLAFDLIILFLSCSFVVYHDFK